MDYWIAKAMEDRPSRRIVWLTLSLVFNLGVLIGFKYLVFLWNHGCLPLLSLATDQTFAPLSAQLPPVGISFFTFQTMSYSIDVYRGHTKACRSFWTFASYVSCFPQLVAGPIVRAKDLLIQMEQPRPQHFSDWNEGGQRFFRGLIKKTCIADPLAISLVDPIFSSPAGQSPTVLVIAMLAYGLQIYYDFSGYSDMAIGLGRCMGFRFPENFDHPYRSASFSEFWTRWHISLSSWLRDYLYISLGGNRGGAIKTGSNLMITMLLGGLWHGASWLFLIWGALHGILLILQRVWMASTSRKLRDLCPRWLAVLLVYACTTLIWVPFRAINLQDVWTFWAAPWQLKGLEFWTYLFQRPPSLILLTIALGFHFLTPKVLQLSRWAQWPMEFKALIWGTLGFWVLSFYPQSDAVTPFIYFQF